MCGIVGIISPDARTQIQRCLDLISHRGPDDEGVYIDNQLAFAHKRLSIQDLSLNGHQPMISDDGNYVIIFNGEIYNHWDIRKVLEKKYPFKSTSDTETILYGFIEFGETILEKLNGIFAFAIYKKNTETIFIARDQYGVKPLYYYVAKDKFWFSSEIKSILAISFDKEINLNALQNYLTFLYSPGEITPFKKVLKLLPGHSITLTTNNFQHYKIKKYYEIPFNNYRTDKSEKELVNELEQKLIKSVERQMLSDVPIGFFLSGGLDSSCIVALAQKIHPDREFNCYTIKTNGGQDFNEGFVNDLFYAQRVAKHLKVNLIEVESNVDIVKDFDTMIYHLDEPQSDPAPLNVFQICKQAKKDGQIVLLGGTAGDDLFSGYRRHQALRMENLWSLTHLSFRKFIQKLSHKLPANKAIFRRIMKMTQNIHLSQVERMAGYFSWLDKETVDQLFLKDNLAQVIPFNPLKIFQDYLLQIPQEKDILNQMLYLEMKFFLADHNLNYTDKMSMATGVEVRVPFLDRELVEFSTQVPTHLKLKGMTTKYLLKKVMEKYLPHEVIYRPKSGFGAPVRKWITMDMDETIKGYLSQRNMNKRNIFNNDKVQKLIHDNKAGIIDASYSIWSLLAIESWMQQFYDTKN
jgi:asparagine synthase (glutamine-hydrolysing)